MKIRYILVFLVGFVGYSQETDFFKIPELTIPSPQASEITKYGDITVDESSGRISPSIPLENFVVGTLNVPVSLSYNGGGIKVMQSPTWTGMSWVLNAGGVITRVVRDLPDETDLVRRFYSQEELDNLITTQQANGTTSFSLPPEAINVFNFPDSYDSQVDQFNFSFPGYSGSFYLKEENGVLKPYVEKYENELKIEIVPDSNVVGNFEFVITTMDGTKYYFGGITTEVGISISPPTYTFEETQFIDRSISPPNFGRRAKTAFYLRKMESYKGDIIYFEYFEKDEYFTVSSREKSINTRFGIDGNSFINGNSSNDNSIEHLMKNYIYGGKFLKRIWSPQTGRNVLFNSIEVDETIQIQGGTETNLKYRVLNSIDYGYKKIGFDYIPSLQIIENGTTDKFLLEKVKTLNADGSAINEEYSFEYDNPLNLPGKLSNSQDYLGYYNGQTNNNLIPKNSSAFFEYYLDVVNLDPLSFENLVYKSNFSDATNLANREPYFSYATRGILKKIIYPTKGFTTFDYEPVDKKILTDNKTMYMYSNKGPLFTPNTIYSSTTDISNSIPLESTTLPPPVVTDHNISVDVTINTDSPQGLDVHDYIYLEVKDIAPSGSFTYSEQRYYFPYSATYPENQQTIFNKSFNVGLTKDHRYEFKMGFVDHETRISAANASIFSQTPMIVNATFNYIVGMDQEDGLGIRVKRTKSYSEDTATPIIKGYYYTKIDELDNENQIDKPKVYHPLFHSISVSGSQEQPNEFGDEGATHLNYYLGLNSSASTQNLSGVDDHIYKNISISLGGDNFENGGIEKTFLIRKNDYQHYFQPSNYPSMTLNDFLFYNFSNLNDSYLIKNGIYNGALIKENYWVKENTILYKVNEKMYGYSFENIEASEVNNINSIKYLGDFCPNCVTGSFGQFYIGLYTTSAIKNQLVKKINKDFIDKIPSTAYNKSIMYYSGWEEDDHDTDGVHNQYDIDYEIYVHDQMETNYKKVVTTEEYVYDAFVNLPTSIKTTTNSNNAVFETKNYYLKDNFEQNITPTLTQGEIDNYTVLKNEFRIDNPIQTESYKNSVLLSKIRNNYNLFPLSNKVDLKVIKGAKGSGTLEDRVVYSSYDAKGNPNEISLADGTKISYIWSYAKQPIYKFVNASISEVNYAINNGNAIDPDDYDENNPMPTITTNPFITSLPKAEVTIYNYDPATRLITSIIDPKGNQITYHYDTFNRLQFIKDKDGNLLNENEYHYRPQN